MSQPKLRRPTHCTFLDPAISGVGGVALFIGAMVVAFVVIGYLIFAIDRALGRVANRK